ncbi:hypothetical protein [Aneurinibacillus terranovensis]|uniref:hypothetical protein n=1 Tax=Aneurinibacillus terranovensis TaxID=278991 RepID=UPI000401A867|nr:hypothetical protein [Aneurinibacillus terranovensis]
MNKFTRAAINILIGLSFVSCSTKAVSENPYQSSVTKQQENFFQNLYREDDKYAGFLNKDTHLVDATATFDGLLLNTFQQTKIKINKIKIANFTLSRIYNLIEHNKVTRDLVEEKSLIDLIGLLNMKSESNGPRLIPFLDLASISACRNT